VFDLWKEERERENKFDHLVLESIIIIIDFKDFEFLVQQ